eukprot:9722201-Lingulodinium_polyedra.AAC.1
MQRIANSRRGFCVRQLFLLDNMSLALAFERSRTSRFGLLAIMRRFNAYALAKNTRCYYRWIPSELNSSDAPSRELDPDSG